MLICLSFFLCLSCFVCFVYWSYSRGRGFASIDGWMVGWMGGQTDKQRLWMVGWKMMDQGGMDGWMRRKMGEGRMQRAVQASKRLARVELQRVSGETSKTPLQF